MTQSIGEPVRKAVQAFRKHRRTTVLKTFAAGVAVAGVVFAAVPASVASASVIPAAGGEATISRSIYLAGQSSDGYAQLVGGGGQGFRVIYLAAGWYNWGYTLSGPGMTAQDSREIWLRAGWYVWGCYIAGIGGAYPASDNYGTYCQLSVQGSGQSAYLPAIANWPSPVYPGDLVDLAPGTYSWVGYLQQG